MSDDITNAIEKLQDTLSREGGVDELKNMVGGLLGGGAQSESGASTGNPMDMIDPEIIFKIKKIYDGINTHDDPRTRLLLALKPYMNTRRMSGIDNALKILNITKISSILKNL